MFSQITWQTYGIALAVCTAVYYVVVFLLFYRGSLKQLAAGKKQRQQVPAIVVDDPEEEADYSNTELERAEDVFIQAEQLADRLKETIADVVEHEFERKELLKLIRMILHEYPALRDSDFRRGINQEILTECGKYPVLDLSEQEVNELWQ